MKLKDLLNIMDVHPSCKTKIKITSPCGYIYSIEELRDKWEEFKNSVIIDILLRNDVLKISVITKGVKQ